MKKTREHKDILFRSIGAYALGDSPAGEDTAIVGYMLNYDHPKYLELKDNFVNHCFDVIVKPSLERLPYKTPQIDTINRIHIIMYADQSKNKILFNDKVRFEANVQLEKDKSYLPGDTISEESIVKVLGLYPNQKNNINSAHILFYKHRLEWYAACDLFYDIERCMSKFFNSKQFLDIAKYALDTQKWGPCIVSLFDSTELAIQSILLLEHKSDYSVKQTHQKTLDLFELRTQYGTIDPTYLEHFRILNHLRNQARYNQGQGQETFVFDIPDSEARRLYQRTEELLKIVNDILDSIKKSKGYRPQGHYISMSDFKY